MSKTDMHRWLAAYPPPKQANKEESLNLARHQKVNNVRAERELDLHGLTWEEAKQEMDNFIARAQRDGIIAVRIIHGKGHHSKTEGGVLKQKVLHYLQQDKRIKKVSQAGYREGQSGACNAIIKLVAKA